MALFTATNMSKAIMELAPKYRRIVEPFGDGGTYVMYGVKKKPKEHIVNIVDEMKFNLFDFCQNFTSADKKRLKGFDWVSSFETFQSVLKIMAMDGAEFFYKYFYQKKFGIMDMTDMEAVPTYDWTTFGDSIKHLLDEIQETKALLKKVTLLNEDPFSVMGKAGGVDTFLILLPKGEDVESVESRLGGLSGNFFFAKKTDVEQLMDAVGKMPNLNIYARNAGSAMSATAQVVINYESKKYPPIDLQAIGYKR